MRSTFVKGPAVLIWICFWLLTGCASQHSVSPGEIKITANPRYDARMAKRILKQWHDEQLHNSAFDYNTGTVKVFFVLYSDGTVSDINITANNAGYVPGWICVEAILKCAPFPKWSSEMVKKLGNHCDVEFTFDYRGQ